MHYPVQETLHETLLDSRLIEVEQKPVVQYHSKIQGREQWEW